MATSGQICFPGEGFPSFFVFSSSLSSEFLSEFLHPDLSSDHVLLCFVCPLPVHSNTPNMANLKEGNFFCRGLTNTMTGHFKSEQGRSVVCDSPGDVLLLLVLLPRMIGLWVDFHSLFFPSKRFPILLLSANAK